MQTQLIILLIIFLTPSHLQDEFPKNPQIFLDLLAKLTDNNSGDNNNNKCNTVQDTKYDVTRTTEYDTRKQSPRGNHYDFIIIGSGSAGSVIANRLSEVFNWKILLLEAGKGENIVSQIPLVAPSLQFTHYNWQHYMEYQPNICLGLENHRMHWPRGKALGGTTVINYMIYTRGNRLDFDRWAAAGNPGWSYNDVLPYFIKSENSTLRHVNNYNYHGTQGYQSVEDTYQSPLVDAFIRGGNELGLPFIDYNAPNQPFGVSTVQANCLKGRRHSAAKAFLKPVKTRKNLHILTSAYVTKILIDPSKKLAYGVEYERNDKKYRVYVNKEVILSAGAYNSPQLLMLAGIGPQKHLQELGIEVIQDLPVGQFLQDHLTYPGLAFLINQTASISLDKILGSLNEFLINGKGPITSLGGVEGLGYIKTEQSHEIIDLPDVELIFVGGSLASDYGISTRRGMKIRDDVYNTLFRPIQTKPQWTIFPMPLHPKSIGYLKLKSKNSHDYPLLYGNYFTDSNNEDIKTFVAAIRFIQKLSRTKPFQKFGSTLNPNRIPGCDEYEFDSDAYWECAVRSIAVTLHHQVGTAKMGPANNPTAVVNHELKVHGINGLRVADCSVIPFAIGAHTSAPALMVGEKAADLIKETWGHAGD